MQPIRQSYITRPFTDSGPDLFYGEVLAGRGGGGRVGRGNAGNENLKRREGGREGAEVGIRKLEETY